MSNETPDGTNEDSPAWQPIEAIDRRVLGVLIEKAKTTPDNYPLSLNALRSGANQKSNRFPQMTQEEDAIEESMERLRKLGAASVIQGGSRIDKFRHLAYDWLGVDKVELAVMGELLLRGAQTIGELRSRAARMEPIKGLEELRPILDSLEAKRLIMYLTPKGRGAVVTHCLYFERELDKVRRDYGGSAPAPTLEPSQSVSATQSAQSTPTPVSAAPTAVAETASDGSVAELLRKVSDELSEIRREHEQTKTETENELQQLRRELDELNRQLGN